MSRLLDALLQEGVGPITGRNAPMLDLRYGGQIGYAPDYTEWVSTTPYMTNQMRCIVIDTPRAWRNRADRAYWIGTFRAIMELHSVSITGVQAGLSIEAIDTSIVGGNGQAFQEIANVTQQRTSPVHRLPEKYGMPIYNFVYAWVTELFMDPSTKMPTVMTMEDRPTDMLADVNSATVLYYEPDATGTRVQKAFLCANVKPNGELPFESRLDLTQGRENPVYDLNFTALTQTGQGVDAFAQRILDGISFLNANPNTRSAFVQEINADVKATRKGFADSVSNVAANQVIL